MNHHVSFVQDNNWSYIVYADPFILHIFNREARYPTEIAAAIDSDFVSPDDFSSPWDGWTRMLKITKTQPPKIQTGLLPFLQAICTKFGYTWETQDRRVRPAGDIPEFAEVPLRDYQLKAVKNAITEGRGVLDMPPRSGKTRTGCEIHRKIALPTIWLAPTDRIVRQTQKVLESFFGKHYVTHQVGSKEIEKAGHQRIVVCTAATAVGLPAEFFKTREVLIVDEFHHASAKTYRQIFNNCEHIYYRYGMTGTFFRSGSDEMAMHGLLSNCIYKISSRELLARGLLVPTQIVFIPVLGPKLRGVDSGYNTGHGKYGIHEHRERNGLVSRVVQSLRKANRRVLILVGTKKQGRLLEELIGSSTCPAPDGAQFKAVEFVCHDTPRSILGQILESFEADQEVKVLIGTSLIGEGVDLPTTDALVYARGEKAEVQVVQNVYRVCTAIDGKRNALIVDFADRHHKKLLEHSLDRLRIYCDEPVFDVQVLQDPRQLYGWLEAVSV